MNKSDFSINKRENVKFEFQKFDIEIIPYLSQLVKLNLTKSYIQLMLEDNDPIENYFSAEWSIVMGIIEQCTNINLDTKQFENILDSGLWDEIKARIVNYNEFRKELEDIYNIIVAKEKFKESLEQSVSNVANSIIEFINKISDLDLSKEGIESLVNALQIQVDKFQEEFPTASNLPAIKTTKKKSKS